jgi:hypothetical protein
VEELVKMYLIEKSAKLGSMNRWNKKWKVPPRNKRDISKRCISNMRRSRGSLLSESTCLVSQQKTGLDHLESSSLWRS